MKSIRFRLLVAGLAVLLGGAIARSQTSDTTTPPSHPRHMMMHGPMGEFFAHNLNLTDEQKSQMKTIMQQERATMKPLMQQLHQTDPQLKQYEQGTFDQGKVQALIAPQAQTLVQLKVEQAHLYNELYQVLTPEQQTQLKANEANWQARKEQHAASNSSNASEQ